MVTVSSPGTTGQTPGLKGSKQMLGRFKETHSGMCHLCNLLYNPSSILILLGSNYESSQGYQQVSEFIAQVSLFAVVHVFL